MHIPAATNQDPALSPIPVSGSPITSWGHEEKESRKRLESMIWRHYSNGLALRKHHSVAWIMVRSFLSGIHYFLIDSRGFWKPIRQKEGEIRSIVPIISPRFRHALGFLASNDINVLVSPIASGSTSIYAADRAQAQLDAWMEDDDVNIPEVKDQFDQLILMEGMAGVFRYKDPIRQNVFLRTLPGSELFPIPYDARSYHEASGLIHATMVTLEWLELQDELYRAQYGQYPADKMATAAGKQAISMQVNLPRVGAIGGGGSLDGALALSVWMKPSPERPFGEYIFMLGERMYRHAPGEAAKEALPCGKIPVEIGYFDKLAHDFWGYGLCETLIPAQLAANRQQTALERNANNNRPMTFFNSESIDAKSVQNAVESFIPFKHNPMDAIKQMSPVFHFPAQSVGRDSDIVLARAISSADDAAGFRSGIVFGQQEGRTESGPATSILSQNAMSSFVPVMGRINRVWDRTFPCVLDMISQTWPENRKIRVAGPAGIGRELLFAREGAPTSDEVIIRTRPLVPGGKQAMLSMLLQLRQMPGQDGTQGSEVSSREFRQALRELDVLPKGLNLADKAENRILTRIALLINDGQQPAIRPSDPANYNDPQVMEEHRLAVELLKEKILDPRAFPAYSQLVQQALLQQLEFHHKLTANAAEHPNAMDDQAEQYQSMQMENYLHAAEQDLLSSEGELNLQ